MEGVSPSKGHLPKIAPREQTRPRRGRSVRTETEVQNVVGGAEQSARGLHASSTRQEKDHPSVRRALSLSCEPLAHSVRDLSLSLSLVETNVVVETRGSANSTAGARWLFRWQAGGQAGRQVGGRAGMAPSERACKKMPKRASRHHPLAVRARVERRQWILELRRPPFGARASESSFHSSPSRALALASVSGSFFLRLPRSQPQLISDAWCDLGALVVSVSQVPDIFRSARIFIRLER